MATALQRARVWTAADLAALPDDPDYRYELVQGRLVKMSPTSGGHGRRASDLHVALGWYVRERQLGVLTAAETGFNLARPGERRETVLAPDSRSSARRTRHSSRWRTFHTWRRISPSRLPRQAIAGDAWARRRDGGWTAACDSSGSCGRVAAKSMCVRPERQARAFSWRQTSWMAAPLYPASASPSRRSAPSDRDAARGRDGNDGEE
jgi:hypothetical protein